MKMRIGYAKIGRAWEPRMDHASTVGGDIDVVRALNRLRLHRPNDTFVMVGKTRVDPRASLGSTNIESPWYDDLSLVGVRRGNVDDQMSAIEPYAINLDALVIWLGQIGGAATALPKIDGTGPITPLQMDVNYAAYICRLVNIWRSIHRDRDVIWLVPDARNRLALHDFRDPPVEPLLAQYNMTRNGVHFAPTPEDPNRFVRAVHHFVYSGVELCAVPNSNVWNVAEDAPPFDSRANFGIVANENKRGKHNRAELLKEWIGDLRDIPIYGTWSAEGVKDLGRQEPIKPIPYEKMYDEVSNWKATLTLPASGSGWATSKPWEMFAAGVVCFFHPAYDDQGHIIAVRSANAETPDEALLSVMLRPETPEEFRVRFRAVTSDPKLHAMIVTAQRNHLLRRFLNDQGGIRMVLERLRRMS